MAPRKPQIQNRVCVIPAKGKESRKTLSSTRRLSAIHARAKATLLKYLVQSALEKVINIKKSSKKLRYHSSQNIINNSTLKKKAIRLFTQVGARTAV